MFTDKLWDWLDSALDVGISEYEFWNMTLAELTRLMDSKRRTIKAEERKKATFDYIQAELIGRSIARIYSSSSKMPSVAEVYPSLFDTEEIREAEQERRNELSILRFKQFAQAHNQQ